MDIFRAACLGSPCVLETNVRLLPPELPYEASRAQDMLTLESRGRAALGTTGEAHYVEHPPSAAVDGDIITAFRSRQGLPAFHSPLVAKIDGYPIQMRRKATTLPLIYSPRYRTLPTERMQSLFCSSLRVHFRSTWLARCKPRPMARPGQRATAPGAALPSGRHRPTMNLVAHRWPAHLMG